MVRAGREKNWYEPTQKLARTTGTRSSEATSFAEVTIGSDGYALLPLLLTALRVHAVLSVAQKS